MRSTQKIATLALMLVMSLGVPSLVSAESEREDREDVREARQEVREVRKNLLQQFRENVGSRAGEFKRFLDKGKAAIGSGKLTAKTDMTLTVERDGVSYTVNIDEKTQLRRRFWGKAELSEFSVGNMVNVIGLWTDDTHTAINATLVRNLSIQRRFGVFFGDVKTLTTTGWVMSTKSEKRADQTVTLSASTKIVNRRGETITQADVKVGHRVRVKGLWDMTLNTVTDVTEVKDFNLPPKPSPEVTPTPTP